MKASGNMINRVVKANACFPVETSTLVRAAAAFLFCTSHATYPTSLLALRSMVGRADARSREDAVQHRGRVSRSVAVPRPSRPGRNAGVCCAELPIQTLMSLAVRTRGLLQGSMGGGHAMG